MPPFPLWRGANTKGAAMSEPETSRGGGQLVAEALARHGTDTVFMVPGESFLEVTDAFYDMGGDHGSGAPRVVTCRHENGAADMAEAHGKLSGRPGVCIVTRGPGAIRAAALAEAT